MKRRGLALLPLGLLLLAVPGLISAAVGLLLVTPPLRGLARRGVQRATERQVSSAVAGDLFGPRRVRVRRGDPTGEPPTPQPATGPITAAPHSGDAVVEGEVVEGEIVR
jgi:UPF0716 protein FxsA